MLNSYQKYTAIHVPVLAIFADPHDLGDAFKFNPSRREAVKARDEQTTTAQAEAFQAGIPQAHVVRIPNASHFIYRSNEAQVLQEIRTFISALPR
jgi:non-heme chloroperoxidase